MIANLFMSVTGSVFAPLPGLFALVGVLWRSSPEEPGALVQCGATPVHCECTQSGLGASFAAGSVCGGASCLFWWWRVARASERVESRSRRLPVHPRGAISFE